MLFRRRFWAKRIEDAWSHRPVVWLVGVRRAGKTVLCQSLRDVEYFDCELPRVRRALSDEGGNLLVAADVDRPFVRTVGAVEVEHVGLADLIERLARA